MRTCRKAALLLPLAAMMAALELWGAIPENSPSVRGAATAAELAKAGKDRMAKRQALGQAIRQGDGESCRKLVESGIDLAQVEPVLEPEGGPLGQAVVQKQADCLEAILAAAAAAGQPVASDDLDRLLNLRDDPKILEIVLKHRPVPQPNEWIAYPPALQKRLETIWTSEAITVFEQAGFRIPLVAWINQGNAEKVKAALARGGAENDLKAGHGRPLAVAVASKSTELVKLLLAAGAKPNCLPDKEGGSVLLLAVSENSPELVTLLLKAKTDPNLVDPERKWTPLHEAVKASSVDLVNQLLKAKAKVNVADENDETPLWLAIRADPKDPAVALVIAEILLKKGADPNRPHIIDGRPVPLLVFCRTDEMRALLQKHGGKFPPGFLKR